MRILFDHQIFSVQRHGGISRYFVELASRLAAMEDTQVDVLAPLHVNAYVGKLGAARLIGVAGPKVGRFTARPRSFLNGALSTAWLATHGYDVVHCTYFAGLPPLPWQRAAVVVTVHDMIHERFPQLFPAWDRTARHKRRAVERAHHVVAVSRATAADLVAMTGVSPDKVTVVHHGCDLPVAGDGATDEAPPPDWGPYLLFVGARTGYKNFLGALEAYARTPALHQGFRLVCLGSTDFLPRERQVLARRGVGADRIHWMVGSDAELARLYAHAAALVYPSHWEGFGMPLLEAMSLGCPVVCSRVPACQEVAGAAAEMFDPQAPADIAAALQRVVLSPARSQELRRLGRERVAGFSWDRCARETLAVYAAAVRRKMTNLRA